MSAYYPSEMTGSANATTIPTGYKPVATSVMARMKRLRATHTYASQTTSDTLVVGSLPPGATWAYGILTADTSSGSTTLAIGTAASTGKYRAAAAFTSTDTPTFFGVTAANTSALTSADAVIVTLAAATAPASGTLIVDLYYSMPN